MQELPTMLNDLSNLLDVYEDPYDDLFITEKDKQNINDQKTFVYLLTNLKNGKKYVGITNDVTARWRAHIYSSTSELYSKKNPYLYNSIKKHGIDNFKFEIIETHEKRQGALDSEKANIAKIKADGGKVYNLTDGGEGTTGYVWTPEQNLASSDRLRGELSPHAKLTNQDAADIRKIYIPYKVTARMIGQIYGVSRDIIKNILLGISYIDEMHGVYQRKTPTKEQKEKRDLDIIKDFLSGKFNRDELSDKYEISDTNISGILNKKVSEISIKKIDDALMTRVSQRRLITYNNPLSSMSERDKLRELRKTINPITSKIYTTQEIAIMYDVDRKTIENNSVEKRYGILKTAEENKQEIDTSFLNSTRKVLTPEEVKNLCDDFHSGKIKRTEELSNIYDIAQSTVIDKLRKFYEDNPNLSRPAWKRVSSKRAPSAAGKISNYGNSTKQGIRKPPSPEKIQEMCEKHHQRIYTNKKQLADDYEYDYSSFIAKLKKYYTNLGIKMPIDPRRKA